MNKSDRKYWQVTGSLRGEPELSFMVDSVRKRRECMLSSFKRAFTCSLVGGRMQVGRRKREDKSSLP
jgi:hypothetical protein